MKRLLHCEISGTYRTSSKAQVSCRKCEHKGLTIVITNSDISIDQDSFFHSAPPDSPAIPTTAILPKLEHFTVVQPQRGPASHRCLNEISAQHCCGSPMRHQQRAARL